MRYCILLVLAAMTCRAGTLLESTQHFLAKQSTSEGSEARLICDLDDHGSRKQWILFIRESKTPVKKGESSKSWIAEKFQSTLHCSTGRDYSFDDDPFAMDVEMVGPFLSGSSEPIVLRQRAVGNRAYFDQGLVPTAQVYERILKSGRPIPLLSFLFRAHYTPQQIQHDRGEAEKAGLSVDDEREIARSGFAMTQFGMIAGKMDSFRDIFGSVIDFPGLFQGIYINIDWNKLESSAIAGGTEMEYRAPIDLQTKAHLWGRVVFTRPNSTSRFCAGFKEMNFDQSQKNPGVSLRIWLLGNGEKGRAN